jgi:hypothetical protein
LVLHEGGFEGDVGFVDDGVHVGFHNIGGKT